MRRSAREFRERTSDWWLRLTNLARRVTFATTTGARWKVRGYETEAGSEEADAPVFGGIGIYARPGSSDQAEGVLIHIGGSAQHPTLVAVRDEDARRAYVAEFGDLEPGEIALHPSSGKARVLLRPDGSIDIEAQAGEEIRVRAKDGTVDALVTRTEFNAHIHAAGALLDGNSTAVTGATAAPASITGTSVLKAQ